MANEPIEIQVRTIDHPGVEPVEALRRLRTYTPNRPSFLLESLGPHDEDRRYSIVGYRTRRTEVLPPAADMAGELAQIEAKPAPETLAQALAVGSIGSVHYESFTLRHGVRLHLDTGPAAVFAIGGAVMVYDHHESKVHVAGRAQGKAVERLLWELEHAPEAPAFAPDAGAKPSKHHRRLGEKTLRARASRVQSYLGDELAAAVVGEDFTAPLGGADPFDVYRALRHQSQARHGFFVDFGVIPNTPHTRIVGVTSTRLHHRRRGGEATSGWATLSAALPHGAMFGDPPLLAARVLRDLEDGARVLWGGAVGYVCPGGESEWVLAETCATIEDESFICSVGARLEASTDLDTVSDLAERGAAAPLSALAAAQAAAPAKS